MTQPTLNRQDEFLRNLVAIARSAKGSPYPGMGLADIVEQIEARLPHLKPVAYENHDLSSGLSWSGHIVCGDKASISAVQLSLHAADNVESFWRPAHLRMQKQLANAKITYEIDVKARDSDEWARQSHPDWWRHTKEDAIDSAWMIRAIAKRETRVLKVTTIVHEEVVE